MVIVGHYEVQDLLSIGGMGEVYRGTDSLTHQPVAIKLLRPEMIAKDPELVERFSREAEALRQLNHPNIVKVLATVEENNQHYIIMEFMSAGSLRDVLARQGRLTVARTLDIALDLSDALTRAHRLKIIHRDLKPANVLIADDGSPRLTDFGVALIGTKERVTESGISVGTPDYMSPEALTGEVVDARADIWGFGVMLFEMLTGQRPFKGTTLASVAASIMTQPTPDLEALCPDCPVGFVDLVYRMLAKDPQQRINSVRIVGAELEAISRSPRLPASQGTPRQSGLDESTLFAERTPTEAPSVPHNLPVQPTAFVGREGELHDLATLLASADVRLVTILGPGGMGKTRLAIETAKAHFQTFPQGVFFVSLAPLSTPDGMVSTIAEAVRFEFRVGTDPRQQLLGFLHAKRILLVLDNFEHLLSGVDIVSDILQSAADVKMIVTTLIQARLAGGDHLSDRRHGFS